MKILRTFCFGLILVWTASVTGFAQNQGIPSTKADSTQRLSKAQLLSMKAIKTESEKKAAPIAMKLAQTAKQIYQNMLSDREDQKLRQKLNAELNKAAVDLLSIKGQSVRDIIHVLTPQQRALIRREMQKPGAPADLTELVGKVFNVSKQESK